MNLELIYYFLSWCLMGSGCIFVLIGALGVLNLPEFWSRLHAASVVESAGMILLIAGLCVHSGLSLITVKLILLIIFLFLTGPTATHAVASAALVSGMKPKSDVKTNDMAND